MFTRSPATMEHQPQIRPRISITKLFMCFGGWPKRKMQLPVNYHSTNPSSFGKVLAEELELFIPNSFRKRQCINNNAFHSDSLVGCGPSSRFAVSNFY